MDSHISIEPVGDEHTDPAPAAAALAQGQTKNPTPAPFIEQDERPHAVRMAHLMMHLASSPERRPVPWYRSRVGGTQ